MSKKKRSRFVVAEKDLVVTKVAKRRVARRRKKKRGK
jgi:hypothetical protein